MDIIGRQVIGRRDTVVTRGNVGIGNANVQAITTLSLRGRNGKTGGNCNADAGIEVIAMAMAFATLVIVRQITPIGANAIP